MARAGEEGHEEHNALRRQDPPPPQAFFGLYDEDDAEGGADPRPQERVQRHTVEHIVDFARFAPMVQILDAPVPQMVEQLPDIMHFFDTIIEVPKILPDDVPMRTAVCDTQLEEQVVEVPTIISFSSLQRIKEQNVDIPVPGGGGRLAGLQGFPPRQGSTAADVEQIVDIPACRPGSLLIESIA